MTVLTAHWRTRVQPIAAIITHLFSFWTMSSKSEWREYQIEDSKARLLKDPLNNSILRTPFIAHVSNVQECKINMRVECGRVLDSHHWEPIAAIRQV